MLKASVVPILAPFAGLFRYCSVLMSRPSLFEVQKTFSAVHEQHTPHMICETLPSDEKVSFRDFSSGIWANSGAKVNGFPVARVSFFQASFGRSTMSSQDLHMPQISALLSKSLRLVAYFRL